MIEEELYERFTQYGVVRGGEHYFERDIALQFVDLCVQNDFAVIGIEGFWISEQTLPDSHWVADFSSTLRGREWGEIKTLNAAEARHFINRAPSGLRFSIVVLSRSEFNARVS
jgi:hypothetical protein